jgi:hypothetical protein
MTMIIYLLIYYRFCTYLFIITSSVRYMDTVKERRRINCARDLNKNQFITSQVNKVDVMPLSNFNQPSCCGETREMGKKKFF